MVKLDVMSMKDSMFICDSVFYSVRELRIAITKEFNDGIANSWTVWPDGSNFHYEYSPKEGGGFESKRFSNPKTGVGVALCTR